MCEESLRVGMEDTQVTKEKCEMAIRLMNIPKIGIYISQKYYIGIK